MASFSWLLFVISIQSSRCSFFQDTLELFTSFWDGYSEPVETSTEANSLHFHVIGDFGLYSQPTSKAKNYMVSDTMSTVASTDSIDFILSVGDNFYTPNGLTDPSDPRISTMMNLTYNKPGLAGKPWYLILGNHDCYGHPDVEISLNGKVNNWNFPSSYYSKVFPLGQSGDQNALFLFLNGCLLSCKDPSKDEQHVCSGFSFTPEPQEIDKHIQWVKDTLKQYSNDESILWRTVVVHWPVFSIASGHGDSKSIKKNLLGTLFEYGVDVVLSGHDHVFQYINMSKDNYVTYGYKDQPDSANECLDTVIGLQANSTLSMAQGEALHQFVSGNCGDDIYELCYDRIVPYEDVVYGATEYGFVDVHVDAQKYEIRNYFVSDEGDWRGRVIIQREN